MAPVLIYFFGFRDMAFFKVPSSSMEPTLAPEDYLVTLNQDTYERGDIVVLRDPTQPGERAYLVKRIVGLPGDEIAVEFGKLLINGKYASEPYTKEPMEWTLEPLRVPEGGVLVLGDNRNESLDGGDWELEPPDRDMTDEERAAWRRAVPMDSIIGRVRYRYRPWSRRGVIPSFPLTNTAGE